MCRSCYTTRPLHAVKFTAKKFKMSDINSTYSILPISNIPTSVTQNNQTVYSSHKKADGSIEHRATTYSVTTYDHTGTVKTVNNSYSVSWIV